MPDASFYEAAKAILERLGYQLGTENVNFLVAWMIKEKGDYPGAGWQWNNPLNTTLACCNWVRNANDAGVKVYPTREDGIEATVRTLSRDWYQNIRTALAANDRNALTSEAVKYDLCVWARGPGGVSTCLYSSNWKDRYADHVISKYLSLGPPPAWVFQGGGETIIPTPSVVIPSVALWLGLLGSVLIAVGLALRR